MSRAHWAIPFKKSYTPMRDINGVQGGEGGWRCNRSLSRGSYIYCPGGGGGGGGGGGQRVLYIVEVDCTICSAPFLHWPLSSIGSVYAFCFVVVILSFIRNAR